MEDATKKNLSAIPDEVLEAIAGGSMNESERAWFLDWAADMKKRGKGIEWTADRFCDMAGVARKQGKRIEFKHVVEILASGL